MPKSINRMMHADGITDWNHPEPQEEVYMPSNSPFYHMPTSGRVQAEEELRKLRDKKEDLLKVEQERFFRALPAQLRKEVIYKTAEFYLRQDAELIFSSDELERVIADQNKLENMLGGGMRRHKNQFEGLAYPYPALIGIEYDRLLELDLECDIDKAVT